MMDRDDLELFERSVRAAVEADDVDAALEELGWGDAYEDDPHVAIATLFRLQGEACARSRALEAVAGSPVLPAEVTIGDDPRSGRWRTEFLYSRAASIYGGSAEIQRNIIARRLLDLGSDR